MAPPSRAPRPVLQRLRCSLPPLTALCMLLGSTQAYDDGSSATAGPEWTGQVLQLTKQPRAYHLKGFLTPDECDWLKKQAAPHLQNSTIVDWKTHKAIPSKVRTSAGMAFGRGHNAVVRNIEERIARLTHLPVENGEGIQVLKYHDGQEYKPHHDFFDESYPFGSSGQRVATVLMYLTTPEEGGETIFPMGKPVRTGPEWSECAQGKYALKATRGDAVFFWAMHPDGVTTDRFSLHGSCPTLKGEKWSATKWIHVKPY
mmetsp:Transcript_3481/g.10115  ORF Transcript_3481/g.10115 Transcript_3481/m.10115 type:complete len:258 (-) Transcript_3481:1437-2210(-)